MAIAVTLLCLAGAGALAQSSSTPPDPRTETAPLEPLRPIVNGHDLQPTVSEIREREAIRHREQPGSAPPGRGSGRADKEVDELYNEVLRNSQPWE
jgi:hypothetical protein